jgi:hypothetical protein
MVLEDSANTWESVLELPATTLAHMLKKSLEYKCLNARAESALKNFASRKRNGQSFTLPQAQFLRSILSQLVDAGAVKRNSRDGDQIECDQVLDALGKP